jgi:hypothetical protein
MIPEVSQQLPQGLLERESAAQVEKDLREPTSSAVDDAAGARPLHRWFRPYTPDGLRQRALEEELAFDVEMKTMLASDDAADTGTPLDLRTEPSATLDAAAPMSEMSQLLPPGVLEQELGVQIEMDHLETSPSVVDDAAGTRPPLDVRREPSAAPDVAAAGDLLVLGADSSPKLKFAEENRRTLQRQISVLSASSCRREAGTLLDDPTRSPPTMVADIDDDEGHLTGPPLAPVVAAGDLQPPSSALDAAASGDLPVLLAGPLPAPSAVLAEAPMERVRPP